MFLFLQGRHFSTRHRSSPIGQVECNGVLVKEERLVSRRSTPTSGPTPPTRRRGTGDEVAPAEESLGAKRVDTLPPYFTPYFGKVLQHSAQVGTVDSTRLDTGGFTHTPPGLAVVGSCPQINLYPRRTPFVRLYVRPGMGFDSPHTPVSLETCV